MQQIRRNNFTLGVVYLFAFLAGLISITARGVEMPKPINPFDKSNPNAAAATEQGSDGMPKDHPCQKVKAACEAAGFYKGGMDKQKGLWKNCIQPLMKGETVSGVNVSATDLSACQQKKAEHKQKTGK